MTLAASANAIEARSTFTIGIPQQQLEMLFTGCRETVSNFNEDPPRFEDLYPESARVPRPTSFSAWVGPEDLTWKSLLIHAYGRTYFAGISGPMGLVEFQDRLCVFPRGRTRSLRLAR